MGNKNHNIALKMAKESIYDDVKYIGVWEGYEIYEPILTNAGLCFIGFPQFVIIKDGKARWSTDWNESIAIMNVLL